MFAYMKDFLVYQDILISTHSSQANDVFTQSPICSPQRDHYIYATMVIFRIHNTLQECFSNRFLLITLIIMKLIHKS